MSKVKKYDLIESIRVRSFLMRFNLLFILLLVALACKANPVISILTENTSSASVLHGVDELENALKTKGISYEKVANLEAVNGETLIVVGLSTGDSYASRLIQAAGHKVPNVPGSLTVWKTSLQEKTVWVIGGYDDQGLMYGLLDVADRISWGSNSQNPLEYLREVTESPAVRDRALSVYTMNRAFWESRFYDKAYWENYLNMMARNRFTTLVVVFGYENGGFLAPCYPYFFDVKEFPEVRMVGLSKEEQQHNLNSLNRLVQMAHDRGIGVRLGIWDHIYRGGVQGGGIPGTEMSDQPIPGLVWGLDENNLYSYTHAALDKLITLVPGIDGIQFRMHDESGLKKEEQGKFWVNIFQLLKEKAPNIKIDLRAKGLTDQMIQDALDIGLDFRISTKYWMEQLGMPYSPTHINRENQFDRRHGYADLLRYPQQYKFHWRLWNGGTTRILLWGNPDYARRFAGASHLYDGDGYEVNEPLVTKMHGQPHDAKPFSLLSPEYQYYDYEFKRYWYFFQLFGRLGYNPDTPSEIWDREFIQRFGAKAGPLVEEALQQASWILPRIVSSVYHYDSSFPMTRGWSEKQRLGDLPLYAAGEGSDIQQFASFDDEARLLIEGEGTAKVLPSRTSQWFRQVAEAVDSLVNAAEAIAGETKENEFVSTVTDLRILSGLARYHSRRIPAAVSYRLYKRTGNISAFDDALAYERNAIDAWRQIVVAAGDIYADDLMMGVPEVIRHNDEFTWKKRLSGHWKNELGYLEEGLIKLEQERQRITPGNNTGTAPQYKIYEGPVSGYENLFQVTHQPIINAPIDQPLTVNVKVTAPAGVKWVRLRYRNVNQEQDYRVLPMVQTGENKNYQATIPAKEVNTKWNLMYFIEVMDKNGNGRIYPDFEKETPYVVVNLVR